MVVLSRDPLAEFALVGILMTDPPSFSCSCHHVPTRRSILSSYYIFEYLWYIIYIWLGSLPCSFLPSPVPAIICQPDSQLYLLYHLFLVGTLNPYARPPFLPSFSFSCYYVPYQPVSQYHFPACKMRTHTIFSQILLMGTGGVEGVEFWTKIVRHLACSPHHFQFCPNF